MGKDYNKYEKVPENREQRLEYVYNLLNIKEKDKMNLIEEISSIKKKRKNRETLEMVFYVVPEGIARPRKGKFGRFYVPNIKKFYEIMDNYIKTHNGLVNEKIFTECKIDCKYYLPIPSDMRKIEKLLAELKYIRSIKKPDWDNLGKSTDMLHKIWLDDALVSEARVRKYYSFKPRIEIKIWYYSEICNSYHKLCVDKLKDKLKKDVKKCVKN